MRDSGVVACGADEVGAELGVQSLVGCEVRLGEEREGKKFSAGGYPALMEGRAERVFQQSRRGVRLRCLHTRPTVTFELRRLVLRRLPRVFSVRGLV